MSGPIGDIGPVPSEIHVPPSAGRSHEARQARRETLGQLVRSKTFVVGMAIVGFWVFWAIAGSRLTPHDPLAQGEEILVRPGSSGHWLGTDQLGRDVLSRVLAGATDVMKVAPLATLLGIVGGTIVGLVTGYFRGVVDDVVSRIIDAVLALPLIVIAVTALVALGSSNWTLIVVIGVVFTPIVGRTVRASVLGERELDYVAAARLRGERAPYVMFTEILPNVMGPIIVEATVRLGYAIFAVAGLTFLGFGVQPPSPDWSLQISDNYTLLASGQYWWTVLFPSLAIATLIVGVNLIADGLQQVVDR
ncbi:ABC-type dipeptide/oligopeptide/nickel transport system permease component [Gaiella occulta]|uniref:ABC-type dipeptide/oligopeptide/nickel transport system permease component n=1 Tax=Gaiella occulta TaxID=1002870 RepID=A0A7M2YX24_9ACTN|nr:ABC-type dipeptide/oligopeptide/nickel transport system permease component [Gaiella occulta]